jgi:hypothetical protein
MTADQLCPPIADLLEEVAGKNHVRVVKYQAGRGASGVRRRRVLDELATSTAALPALFLHDSLRALRGLRPIYAAEALRRLGGDWVGAFPNLRTTVGADYCANALGSTSQPSQADYIALSNNTNAPAAGDTSATVQWATGNATDGAASATRAEWTGLGLTRKQATYAHTTSTATYTMSATWTATGTATSTQLAGLFGGAAKTSQSNGATNILFLENTFTATTLNTNDQLSLTWTITV